MRAETLAALGRLVHNPLAQPVLKAVLPRAHSLLFDRTQKVRLAVVDLLLEVRSVLGCLTPTQPYPGQASCVAMRRSCSRGTVDCRSPMDLLFSPRP